MRNLTATKQTLKAVGKEVPQNFELKVVLGFAVEDETSEGFQLKETVEEVTFTPEKGDPISDEKIKGSSFAVTLSKKWEILKFEGHDKLIDKLAGDDVAVRQALQAILSEEILKKSVRELMSFVPDRPVKDGETWERSIEEPLGPLGMLRETRTYKAEGKVDFSGTKVDKVTFATAVDFKAGKPDKTLPYYVISGEMKTDAEQPRGTLLFDSAAGRLVQIEVPLKLRGRMSLSIPASGVTINDILVEQEQTTKVAVFKEKPAK